MMLLSRPSEDRGGMAEGVVRTWYVTGHEAVQSRRRWNHPGFIGHLSNAQIGILTCPAFRSPSRQNGARRSNEFTMYVALPTVLQVEDGRRSVRSVFGAPTDDDRLRPPRVTIAAPGRSTGARRREILRMHDRRNVVAAPRRRGRPLLLRG